MMAKKIKVKVIYDRESCIGAVTCTVAAPKYWKMNDDGKADLIGGKKNKKTGKWELEIELTENEFKALEESAVACPVQVIKITKE